jgi:hypothetical protein
LVGDLSGQHPLLHKFAFGNSECGRGSVSEQPLTVDEVAEFMRVSSRTVMRAIAS